MRKRRKRVRVRARARARARARVRGVVEAEKAVEEQDGGVDELLAMLGYKVRCSDMFDIAQKLEQLEMAMGSSITQDDAFLFHLASDIVHYNPSDLSNWLESMLSELNAPPPPLPSWGALRAQRAASSPPVLHPNSQLLEQPFRATPGPHRLSLNS